MSPVMQIFESRLVGKCALLVAGCLFKAGLAMGMPMPMPAQGDAAGSSGTISFSGAVVTGTCAAPVAAAADGALGGVSARGECRSGESHVGYRVNVRDIGDRPAIRLLQYAKDRYGKAMVVTYVYD